jgi:polyphosphate:AMP phosphotransferase
VATSPEAGLFAAAEVGHELEHDDYKLRLDALRVELLNAQFELGSADFSTVVLLAGDDRPGCVEVAQTLAEWMDARYMETHALFGEGRRSEGDLERPAHYRYWRPLPPKGRMGVYLGAWASELVGTAISGDIDELDFERGIKYIESFERALARDGTLLLKFWLHLPKDVLKKRLKKAKKSPDTHWQIETRDWEVLENYDEGLELVERLVRRTNTPDAPWSIVESTDRRYRNLTVAQRINESLARRLAAPASVPRPAPVVDYLPPVDGQLALDRVDLSATVDKQSYDDQLERLQAQINRSSREMREQGIASVLAFEGWDAAGKGGTIRRLTKAMPIVNYHVVPIAAPTDEEAARHYLWRFWRHIPRDGMTVIFDRSWYGRVLVERIENFAAEDEWRRAYGEINDFESHLCDHGIPVLKFWLHLSQDEQLRRFEARAETPYKKYKLTDDDYRNREKWPQYERAVHDMVTQTSTARAPWYLIAANDKRWARIQVLDAVCRRFEERLAVDKKSNKKGKKS